LSKYILSLQRQWWMMDFHKVKMYKDKRVNKNVKDIFVNVWRKSVFDIYFRS
jgi:hypothetical protein